MTIIGYRDFGTVTRVLVCYHRIEYHEKDTLPKLAGGFAVAGTVYGLWLRPWHLHWGATEQEVGETPPGDEITPHVKGQATHTITIQGPATEVWKWLVQIGQDKGGFYSQDFRFEKGISPCRRRFQSRRSGFKRKS